MSLREGLIDFGFRVFDATKLHRAATRFSRGLGAILMFHRVRPACPETAFAPNGGLEITPEYLDLVLTHVRASGFDILSLDDSLVRIAEPAEKPFVALTFDDATRDTADIALPILERHGAPFTMYVTTGFADRSARMWWLELEAAIRALDHIDVVLGQTRFDLPLRTLSEKRAGHAAIYKALRGGRKDDLLDGCAALCALANIDTAAIVEDACLDWDGIRAVAGHRLATVAAHTLTHPMLAKFPRERALAEMADGKRIIEAQLGRKVDHFAYPHGDPASAGPREFAIAREIGFASAVTTRPGMLFAEHAAHATALPRLSINGGFQTAGALDVLLSGAPFLLMNGGRRLSVA